MCSLLLNPEKRISFLLTPENVCLGIQKQNILLELGIGFAHISRGSELSAWDFKKEKNVLLELETAQYF